MTDIAEIQDEVQEVPVEIHQLRWSSLRRRIGHFKIAAEMLEDNAAAVLAIMGECIVTRCEHRWDVAIFDYTAVSWQFHELVKGGLAPEYIWEKNGDGDWTAKNKVMR